MLWAIAKRCLRLPAFVFAVNVLEDSGSFITFAAFLWAGPPLLDGRIVLRAMKLSPYACMVNEVKRLSCYVNTGPPERLPLTPLQLDQSQQLVLAVGEPVDLQPPSAHNLNLVSPKTSIWTGPAGFAAKPGRRSSR